MSFKRLEPYNMNHKSRGQVLVFNNKNYPQKTGYPPRDFSDVDATKMFGCLTSLGYKASEIKMKRDQKAREMETAIEKLAADDHSDSDTVVVVFLSYGEHNIIFAKDKQIGIQKLLAPLKGDKCHYSLVGKPKIIILQTCNPTTVVLANDGTEKDVPISRIIPTEADFVYLGTEVAGLVPDRECTKGSLFIDHLTKQLTAAGKSPIELRRAATRTLAAVGKEMDEKVNNWTDYDDRMPFFVSMLTRDLYFKAESKTEEKTEEKQ